MTTEIQTLYDKMESTRKALFSKLDGYTSEKMNQKPDENTWSVIQVMNHLSGAEGGSVKYMNKKLSFNPKLKKAGLGSSLRYMLLITAFSLPLKFKVPDVVGQPSNDDNYDEAKAKWDKVRADLKTLLESLNEDQLKAELWKHPSAGKMNMRYALKFMQEHFDRHQGQIERILKLIS